MPDDVASAVKEANVDDDMEEEDDDDPDKYFNTAYDDGGLMAQDGEDSGYERGDDDLMLPDLPELERPKVECKKSLFKRSSQETPPDATCTQQPLEARPLISPTTLGWLLGKVWWDHYRHPPRSKGGDQTRKALKEPELLQVASRLWSPGW